MNETAWHFFYAFVGLLAGYIITDILRSKIMEIKLKSSGKQEVVFPAGYLNRAARRRMKKMNMQNVHRVIEKPCTKNENKED
jgi:hypothetical protein